MPISFPPTSVVGTKHSEGDKTWQWNGTAWDSVKTGAAVYTNIAPNDPADGQYWVDKSTAQMYYGSNGNWIQLTTSTHTHQV